MPMQFAVSSAHEGNPPCLLCGEALTPEDGECVYLPVGDDLRGLCYHCGMKVAGVIASLYDYHLAPNRT